MPPSLARDFFDQITADADPARFIRSLVTSSPPRAETDYLDFKVSPGKLNDSKIRQMWCEALSGFANNQGGVLVWGIEARKTLIDGIGEIDAACGERLVGQPSAFESRLRELQRGATDPPLANVEIRAFEAPTAPGKGFVVCFVPEGPFKPYRTEEGRTSQFYLRAGDNFVTMSRAMLQALFYPRLKARFSVEGELTWTLGEDERAVSRAIVDVRLRVTNHGPATARNAAIRVDHNILEIKAQPDVLLQQEQWGKNAEWNCENNFFFRLGAFHPGMPASTFFSWLWTVVTTIRADKDNLVTPVLHEPSFTASVFCEDQDAQKFQIDFNLADMTEEDKKYVIQGVPIQSIP
jgi:hypothetical protein